MRRGHGPEIRPRLIVLSAPSGAGKTTLAQAMLERFPKLRLSISHTTRVPRAHEVHGVHYFFVNTKEFEDLISENQFLEYEHVFQKYYYGTSKSWVEDQFSSGFHVLFDIDVKGAETLKKIYGDRCVTIFILPPSIYELGVRLKNRGTETADQLAWRLESARSELCHAENFDYRITNISLSKSIQYLEAILKNEGIE